MKKLLSVLFALIIGLTIVVLYQYVAISSGIMSENTALRIKVGGAIGIIAISFSYKRLRKGIFSDNKNETPSTKQ